MNTSEKKTLEHLIQINLDSSKIYRIAAENSHDPNIQSFFDKSAINREETMRKLMEKTGQTEEDPSLKAELQQFWINLKSAKKEFDAVALIDECIDAEKQFHKDLQNTESKNQVSDEFNKLIEKEKEEAENNINQLKEYRSTFKKSDDEKNRQTPV